MARRDDDNDEDRRPSRSRERDDDDRGKRRDDDDRRDTRSSARDRDDDKDDRRGKDRKGKDEDEGDNGEIDYPSKDDEAGEYFEYEGRSAEDISQRANQRGGNFDTPIKSTFPTFKAKEGKNRIRIMRPTWKDKKRWGNSWGIEVNLHTNIGTDTNIYPCLAKMKGEACPICEARVDEPDEKVKKNLTIKRRVYAWVIDRADEDSGPKVWDMGWTVERDISSVCVDESGGALLIDDPERGYDLTFKREGTKKNTQYFGFVLDRNDSPVHDKQKVQKKWEDFTFQHPLPSVLHYYTYDHMKASYDAAPDKVREDDDDKKNDRDDGDRKKGRDRDDEDRGRRSGRQRGDDDDDRRPSSRARDEEPPARSRDREEPARRGPRRDQEEDDDIPENLKGKEPEPREERRSRRDPDEDENKEEERGGKNERKSRKNAESSSDKAKASLDKMRDQERGDGEDERPSSARSADGRRPRDGDARSAGRGRTDDDDDDRRPSRRRDDD